MVHTPVQYNSLYFDLFFQALLVVSKLLLLIMQLLLKFIYLLKIHVEFKVFFSLLKIFKLYFQGCLSFPEICDSDLLWSIMKIVKIVDLRRNWEVLTSATAFILLNSCSMVSQYCFSCLCWDIGTTLFSYGSLFDDLFRKELIPSSELF